MALSEARSATLPLKVTLAPTGPVAPIDPT